MASAKLIVFCTPEEMHDWLEAVRIERGTAFVVFVGSGKGSVVGGGESLPALGDVERVFILPSKDAPQKAIELEDVRARERGWVDVRPPRRIAGKVPMLLMGQVHGEDASSGTTFASNGVKWLRKRIANALMSPVEGVNVVTDGTDVYSSMYYTEGAKAEFEEGVEWRQFPKGNVIFRPTT